MTGPLQSMKVVELAGLGPAPFCGMLLADLGAEVVRVDRVESATGKDDRSRRHDLLGRGKRSVAVDLKSHEGVEVVLRLVEASDALIEGFRPGVAERMGLGPAECHTRNPSLVFGRMTGWGQDGPLSHRAGHDIDYIALSGALASIGPEEAPTVPLNLVGDFGGGGMLLAFGVVAALLAVDRGAPGQVVDASMAEGSALLMTSHHGYLAEGWWLPRRASNPLDGAAPYYTTYPTSDGKHMAVGAIEPQFYSELLEALGLESGDLPHQNDRENWPVLRSALAQRFATRTRDEWEVVFEGADACVAPVLDMTEAPHHRHNRERRAFVEIDGVIQPAPAPRFSATPSPIPHGPILPGADTDEVLESLGYRPEEIVMLRRSHTVA